MTNHLPPSSPRFLQSSTGAKYYSFVCFFVFFVLLVLAAAFPLITDEAYYMDWARRSTFPDFGFFDHPPFVSWQGFLARFEHEIFFARLGVFATSLATFYFNWRSAYLLSNKRTTAWAAAVTAQITIGGMANAILLTPDSGLALWWSIALHEGIVALKQNPKRWLTAGAATGMGLLSKYTMALIGPIYLYALLRERSAGERKNKQLYTPWPYLGGLVALLVFSPNLLWNAEHHWTTISFQFGHGLSVQQEMITGSLLPHAVPSEEDSSTFVLYKELQTAMGSVPGFEETKHRPKPEKSRLERAWQYTGDYLGGVAALWGGLVFVALGLLRHLYRSRHSSRESILPHDSNALRLYQAAAIGPVLFFLALSPFTRIEANWPAMHMAPAAFFVAAYWKPSWRMLLQFFVVHAVLVTALLLVVWFPSKIPFTRNNRMINESAGYEHLAWYLKSSLSAPLLAVDSYQLKAVLAARAPGITTSQWPGITRPSDYTLGNTDDLQSDQAFLDAKTFSLLTFQDFPPELPTYRAVSLQGIRSCPDGRIAAFSAQSPVLPCVKGLRDWWLVSYEKLSDTL